MNRVEASDAELVRAARRGDKTAFVEIVTRHQAMVCGIALGILGDFSSSEDAGQEAFLVAWQKLHQLQDPSRLRAWLGQIARNSALMQLRRKRGHEVLEEGLDVPDCALEPDERAATREEAELVTQILSQLPEAYRMPLILFYREGRSVRAVAEALDLSEDNVKQRLARGRELIRERLSGSIERVLTKTRPNAAFTIAIASAIGALAAPSAIAATAFAGAHAAPVASADWITFMSATKNTVICAAIAAAVCLPLGYNFAIPHPAVQRQMAATNEIRAATPPAEATPPLDSKLLAEWRELHNIHGRTGAAMPSLYQAIADIKDPFRRRAFRTALFSEWAQLDGAGAFAFLNEKKADEGQRKQLFTEWLELDSKAAVAAALTAGTDWDSVVRSSLTRIAKTTPSAVPQLAARLQKTDDYWDTSVRDAFSTLAESDLGKARDAAEKLEGPNREQARAGVARAWGKTDLDGAVKWARNFSGPEGDEVVRLALMGRAAINPTEALDKISLAPAGGRNNYFATSTGARVLAEAAKADFEATAAWIAQRPGRLRYDDLMGIAEAVTTRLNANTAEFLSARLADGSLAALQPAIESALMNGSGGQREAVWEWLRGQPDSETVRDMRRIVLHRAAWQDTALALRLVDEVPRNPDGDKEIASLAERLFNGGHQLHRLDGLLQDSPERLKQPLLEAAFRFLGGNTMADPAPWIARLSLLPESARPQGIESLANAWAQNNPEEALKWAASLPSQNARDTALDGAAKGFARNDAYAAAEWVRTLPVGSQRDSVSLTLVKTIADKYPREAWQWALSIQNPPQQKEAALHAIQTVARQDAASANWMIDAANLSSALRTELRGAISTTASKIH